jgi:hypothetical protein
VVSPSDSVSVSGPETSTPAEDAEDQSDCRLNTTGTYRRFNVISVEDQSDCRLSYKVPINWTI